MTVPTAAKEAAASCVRGIKYSGTSSKTLATGEIHAVMLGGMLAGTDESPIVESTRAVVSGLSW